MKVGGKSTFSFCTTHQSDELQQQGYLSILYLLPLKILFDRLLIPIMEEI